MKKRKGAKRKTKIYRDQYAEREAEKYDNPIASRELILRYLGDCRAPRLQSEIASDLGLESAEQQEALRRRLRAMERDGQVIRNRRKEFGLIDRMDLIRGRVIGHPDGFGFLVPDSGGEDVFLPAKEMRGLLHGDRAVARTVSKDRRGRIEGAVVDVLERANAQVVGRYFTEEGIGFVVPDNKRISQDILIAEKDRGKATDGQIVVASIVDHPTKRHQPIGRIVEVLGEHMAPGMEVDIAIRVHELPQIWPPEVEREIAGLSNRVQAKDKHGRVDLRALPLVTIDGEDARDFDDAVYCEPQGDGWRLIVAIADVSHYVHHATALDDEAIKRGNSVYFPDRVIPMLPELLSNGLCSLNPKVDRLCMVCEMTIGQKGAAKDYRFYEGVMRSAARLTYTEVAKAVVDRDGGARKRLQVVVQPLEHLYQLYQLFAKRRGMRGAIEFDSTETQILFGDEGKIERIVPRTRNDAHRMIEEFMIAANVCAARFLLKKKIPALYRVHEPPAEDDLDNLRLFLNELGVSLGGGDKPKAADYAKTLQTIEGRDDAHLIQTVLLRSLKLAVYHPKNTGHFGLAYDAYTHFTSPIRRYPDLLVHRAIRHLLREKGGQGFVYNGAAMEHFGEQCSMTERRADEATRDAINWLKCEFMMDKVGEVFDGVISGVTGFGLFVELSEVFVEGLVHITSLDKDYYHFDPIRHRLTGERSRRVYRLASPVKVQVTRVDLDEKKIDFVLA